MSSLVMEKCVEEGKAQEDQLFISMALEGQTCTNKGGWMEVYTGTKFYPVFPRAKDVSIVDIAHSLSLLCRFNGHCAYFYSVGHHSLNCYEVAKSSYSSIRIQFFALMHDAAEAYLSDIVRPLKPFVQGYKDLEDNVEFAVWKHFGYTPTEAEWAIVKRIDDAVLRSEGKILMNNIDNWADDGESADVDLDERPYQEVADEFLVTAGKLLVELKKSEG